MILYPKDVNENEILRAWLEKRIPGTDLGNDSWCLGVWRDGKLLAVAGFNNYRKVDIEISFAADHPRWATKETVAWILGFPFLQLKTQRCSAMVLKSNKRVRKLLNGIGFKEEGRHAHAGPNKETMFSYGMVRDEYLKRYVDGLKVATRTSAAA